MGLLDKSPSEYAIGKLGLNSITRKNTSGKPEPADFLSGFKCVEYENGKAKSESDGFGFTLLGSFMPMVPFTFGGSQEVKKDYYAGNSEPVVQILGPRESDLTIKGRFKTKKFKDKNLKGAALEYQEQCDSVRIRGNLLYLQMGEWHRWGYLKDVSFDLSRTTDIMYSLTFDIVGFNPPSNCKSLRAPSDNVVQANKDLIKSAADALANMAIYPESMPRTLEEFLNDQLGAVAEAINLVTDFVDNVLGDIESLERSANRALGLIKNARTTISKTGRRIGAISMGIASLGAGFSSAAEQTTATFNNTVHFKKIATGFSSFQTLLAELQKRYAGLISSTPLKRHLVVEGDTLQRLAMKYYNDADLWKKIYDHNKLATVDLTNVKLLEIPRQ
jgi:hypothetical protein